MHYPLCWLLVFIAPMSTIRAQSISDFAGPWKGELTQPGTTFDFDLDLRVAEGNKLTGSTRVGTKGTAFFGRMSVEAAVNGSSLFFQERKIIEQNLDPAISRWCIKSARLTLTSDRLEGIWSQPGCNEGSIRLVKKREPICGDPGIVDQMPTTSVPVAYGPHLYEVRNTICSTSSPGCSKSAVFLTMLRSRSYVAPTSNRKPVENCAETILQFPGDSYAPIKTTVTAKGGEYSATNYTLPGHLLHPGKVLSRRPNFVQRIHSISTFS